MARRSRRDEDLDAELDPERGGADARRDDKPSRTARKRASEELQALGEQLAALPEAAIARLPLPESVKDALSAAKRLKSFGARRRHAQYIGKLMRRFDADALAAARAAVRAAHVSRQRD
jgi:ribosome-associated protein